MAFSYPKPRRDESVVDNLFGVSVADPYRWMEDPDAQETKSFVDEQNVITMDFLEKCPIRQKIHSRLTEMWNYPKFGCPMKRGNNYFYFHNTGLQNQSVLYIQDSIDGEPRVFFDANSLSEDGTVAISNYKFSEDGSIFAYALSSSGSDWKTIKFKDVNSGNILDDSLEKCKFSSMAWTHDNKGFFYNKYLNVDNASGTQTTSNVDQKLFYHKIGTTQDEDILCLEFVDNPKWMIGVEVSDCGKYLVISVEEGCAPVNRLYYSDLSALSDGVVGLIPYVKVVDNFDAEYQYIANEGSIFTFKTNLKAPNYKLISIDFQNDQPENWKTLIDEDPKDVLEWVACVNNDKMVVCYIQDVKNVLYVFSLNDGCILNSIPISLGSIVQFDGKRTHTEIFYKFMSILEAGTIYRVDMTGTTFEPILFKSTDVVGFEASIFETSQVFFSSKDGTKVPMYIVHKKGIKLDGNNPTMLYGYGGFNISLLPTFSVANILFLNHFNGVYALPNIRGGGEYGEKWHKAGCFDNKQNVFDDFQAAAEYLINAKYTSASKLAIRGGSNGGLLVGACANQRPELYGCVLNHVGVMDMLRFHKFTIGHAWTTDFGNPDKEKDFHYIYKYSPLHNIREPAGDKQYPSTLLFTADHDDRVSPLHSLKYMAELHHTLKDCSKQTNPLLIRVDTKAGHGAGKPTSKVIEEYQDVYCFMVRTLGLTWED